MPSTVSSETIRAAQILLVGFGFPLDMDGVLGANTMKALKQFQRTRKLAPTGRLDAATLKALGLRAPIEFELDETEVPSHVRKRINDYTGMLERQHQTLLDKSRDALLNFQTTLSTASISEANPDLVSVLASAAYQAGSSLLQSYIKNNAAGAGVAFVVEVASGVSAELDRAAAATVDRQVAGFVKEAVRAIDRRRQRFHPGELAEEVSLNFLESSDRQAFLDGLLAATEGLEKDVLPTLPFFELRCYEAWINMHFNGFREDGQGVIGYRFAFDGEIEVLSCRLEAPHRERIEDELNGFFASRAIDGVRRPIDLRVRKRACFQVKNTVGGPLTGCGWLSVSGKVEQRPSLAKAQRAFAEPVWQVAVSKFTR